MIAITCALVGAAGFYFSIGLGEEWWLAWLAPIPVLWFAFGQAKGRRVFAVAFAAVALGTANILRAYGGLLPLPVMTLAICGPALLFAIAVMGARRVRQTLGPVPAMFAFAVLWTAFDFLSAFSKAGGAASTPAAAEVGAPMLIQIASLVGFLGITFLLGLFPAGIAASLRSRSPVPAAIAMIAFCANVSFGYLRMAPPTAVIHTALVNSNDATGEIHADDRAAAFKAVDAYVAEIEKLRGRSVMLIVLPENIALVAPPWRDDLKSRLASAASDVGATLVAGFNTNVDGAERNVSFAFSPTQNLTYVKRHLVAGLETRVYAPGPGPLALSNGTGLEICKDMDFHAMVRADMVSTKPRLLAVPAWDFVTDDWSHARVAIMRSVENGVPMARTARDGLLTLNDQYGRVVARATSERGFTTLVGDLPLDGRGGGTIYDRIGDLFGWICLVASLVLVGWSFAPRTRGLNDAANSPAR